MKQLIAILIAAAFSFGVSAQELKRPEHNIQLGIGVFSFGSETPFRMDDLSARLSYGVDIPVAGAWSVMPELGVKLYQERLFAGGAVGANFDSLCYLDMAVSIRYRTQKRWIFGLGPMLSYSWSPDKYYVDSDPSSPLNKKAKNTPFNLSIRPGVYWTPGKIWSLGLEAEIGLLNAMVQYPEYGRTGNRHIHAVRLVVGVRF
jgi:hypothetical protein